LDQGVLREYPERRSLYRLLPAFSGCSERERLEPDELAAYTLAESEADRTRPPATVPPTERKSVDTREASFKKGDDVFIINRAVPLSDVPAVFERFLGDEFALVTAYGEQ